MRIRIEITPGALIGGAVLLMILPLRWLFGALIAASVHELFHFGAIMVSGGEVKDVRIGIGGARMLTGVLSPRREFICAAAGPVGSFSLLLFAKYIPAAALCGLVQGVFNLLPLFPLDGGRMLHCGLETIFPGISFSAIKCVETGAEILSISLIIIGVIRLGIWVPVLLPVIVLKWLSVKKPLQRFQTRGTIEKD